LVLWFVGLLARWSGVGYAPVYAAQDPEGENTDLALARV